MDDSAVCGLTYLTGMVLAFVWGLIWGERTCDNMMRGLFIVFGAIFWPMLILLLVFEVVGWFAVHVRRRVEEFKMRKIWKGSGK